MLTVMRLFVPSIKDIHYSIMEHYCLEQAKYYCRLEDGKKGLYWSQMASKYLLKRLDLLAKRGSH